MSTTQIQKAEKKPKTTKDLLASDQVRSKFNEVLGKKTASFIASVVQCMQQNSLLAKAEPNSVLQAAMIAATLDLPINNSLGFAYIIPYKEKDKTTGQYKDVAQFQIGAKGYKQLALRSGQFKNIHATDVKDGEIKSRNRLTGEIKFEWIEDEAQRKELATIGYAAHFTLLNGFEATLYMTVQDIDAHAKRYSQTYKKGFGVWKDNFDAMAEKTVLKLLLSKEAPLSIEMQKAIETDQAVVNDSETQDVSYVDADEDKEQERICLLIEDCTNIEGLQKLHPHLTTQLTVDIYNQKYHELNG